MGDGYLVGRAVLELGADPDRVQPLHAVQYSGEPGGDMGCAPA